MTMITVNILWNRKKFHTVCADRKEVKTEIMQKISERCASQKISGYSLMRFSKNLNMFTSTELKVVLDGDIINVETANEDETDSEDQHLSAMKKITKGNESSFKKQLMNKIQGNGFFNDADRKYMSHYFEYHENCGKNESSECKTGVAKSELEAPSHTDVDQSINNGCPKTNRKRSLNGNDEMKEPHKKQKTANVGTQYAKKTVDVGTQCVMSDFGFKPSSQLQHSPVDDVCGTAESTCSEVLPDLETTKNEAVDVTTDIQVVNDYSKVKKYLNMYPEIPQKERDPETFRKFSDMLFFERRAFVINQEPRAETLKEIYPYMFSYQQMVREFELIVEKEDMYKKFKCNVRKYRTSVLALAPKNRKCQIIKEKIKEGSNDDEKLRLEMAGSLLLIPMYMGEKLKDVVICKDENPTPDRTHPYIRSTSDVDNLLAETTKLSIVMEGVEVCRPPNLLKAFLALVAVHYVFNAEYYCNCEKTCTVLEQLYVGYTDEHIEIDNSVKARIEKLEQALETSTS